MPLHFSAGDVRAGLGVAACILLLLAAVPPAPAQNAAAAQAAKVPAKPAAQLPAGALTDYQGPVKPPPPVQKTMPDLRGMPLEEAQYRLKVLELKSQLRHAFACGSMPNTVVAQDPPAGASFTYPQVATLDIEEPVQSTQVPRLIDLTPEMAEQVLNKYRLCLGAKSEEAAEGTVGTVLRQSADPGTQANSGATVDIVLRTAPATVPPPPPPPPQADIKVGLSVFRREDVVGSDFELTARIAGATASEYRFHFDDGTPDIRSNSDQVIHRYASEGTYFPSVVISGEGFKPRVAKARVSVLPVPIPPPPPPPPPRSWVPWAIGGGGGAIVLTGLFFLLRQPPPPPTPAPTPLSTGLTLKGRHGRLRASVHSREPTLTRGSLELRGQRGASRTDLHAPDPLVKGARRLP